MQVAIIAKLRNGVLLRYRRELGLSQCAAARIAFVSTFQWNSVECMRFNNVSWPAINRIADCIGVHVDEVCPEELRTLNFIAERTSYKNVKLPNMLPLNKEAMLLPDLRSLREIKEIIEQKDTPESAKPAELIDIILNTLTKRQRKVLILRFGLFGEKPRTLINIAKICHVSKQAISSIEVRAIRKLQKPARAIGLDSLMSVSESHET